MKNRRIIKLVLFFAIFSILNVNCVNAAMIEGDTLLDLSNESDLSKKSQTALFRVKSGLSGSWGVGTISAIIIRSIFSLLGVIFIGMMIYAGYLWMTARGNEQQVEKAQKLIQQSIIGLIIIIASYAITYFVFSHLPGDGPSGATSPGYYTE